MTYTPALTPQAIAERQTWQYKAIAYAQGNKSQVGALVLAIMGRLVKPPCFHPRGAKITKEGHVLALYKRDNFAVWKVERVYENVEAFTAVFRGLAAELKLDDQQNEAMFSEIRKWVFEDERAKSTLE